MELKRVTAYPRQPRWPPFNRTTMELKHRRGLQTTTGASTLPFNQTTMELKHGAIRLHGRSLHPFNQTTMELKQVTGLLVARASELLIKPLWN